MPIVSPLSYIIRAATRKPTEKLNILTFPTHERYESMLAKTGHNFYAYRAEGIKGCGKEKTICCECYPKAVWGQPVRFLFVCFESKEKKEWIICTQ